MTTAHVLTRTTFTPDGNGGDYAHTEVMGVFSTADGAQEAADSVSGQTEIAEFILDGFDSHGNNDTEPDPIPATATSSDEWGVDGWRQAFCGALISAAQSWRTGARPISLGEDRAAESCRELYFRNSVEGAERRLQEARSGLRRAEEELKEAHVLASQSGFDPIGGGHE